MDMGVLFNPQGRIGPAAFMKAAIVLIVIGAVFSLLPLFGQTFLFLSSLSIFLLYPWAVIWAKRFHDADKSGWLFLLALVLYLVASYAAAFLMTPLLGLSATPPAGTDLAAMMTTMTEQQRALAIPNAILGVVVSFVFVFIGNMILKTDPEANPYGAPTAA